MLLLAHSIEPPPRNDHDTPLVYAMFSKNRRGILWLLVLVALVAAGIGTAIPFLQPRLPDPAVASRDELLRWLVARDLAKESPQTQSCSALLLH